MRTLTQEEKVVLRKVIEEGENVLSQVQQMKDDLREDVKAVAENLEIKPALINKAIRVAHKHNLGEVKNNISEVEEILIAAGKKI
jgi:hypothetical protein